MKQFAVCLVIVIAVKCAAMTHAQDFCHPEGTQSTIMRDDVTVTSSKGVVTFLRSQDDLSSHSPEFEPRTGAHDLVLGDCAAGGFNIAYPLALCRAPFNDPSDGTSSDNVTITFRDAVLACISVVDAYNNDEGEDFGGYPYLDAGGIGEKFFTVRFVYRNVHGMKFDIFVGATTGTVTTDTSTVATTTTSATTVGTTTTPAPGGADAVGKSRWSWIVLSYLMLVLKNYV